jgi:voltage-gated potassium channel Kch
MAGPNVTELEPQQRRRLLASALLRAVLIAAALVAFYYLVPVDGSGRLSVGLRLLVAAAGFLVVVAWALRRILYSSQPGIRAIEAVACSLPLFLLLFASTYFLLSADASGSFSQPHLSKTDALYFTVTTFATVGYGDISPTSESARVIVMSQMLLDLLILGLGINAFVSAVRISRKRQEATDAGSSP